MNNRKYQVMDNSFNEINMVVLEHGLLETDGGWNYRKIISPFNRLYFMLEGEGEVQNEYQSVRLKQGFVYFIPAGTCYDYREIRHIRKLYFHMQIQWVSGLDCFYGCNEVMGQKCDGRDLEVLMQALDKGGNEDALRIKGILYQYASIFSGEASKKQGGLQNYQGFWKQKELLAYLEKHISAKLTLKDIAAAHHVSYYTLSRNFKRDTGMGLKKYMEILLLDRARKYLLMTDMQIQEVAGLLGFSDAFYFSRFFQQNDGRSPREFRKRMRGIF